jgi:hypothetical protein
MTPDETVTLARYVRALCPQQRFDEYTPDAWHDILFPFHLAEARTAAAAIASAQPFVSPGEIAAHVRRARADRLHRHTDPTPQADPDNVAAYQAELRATRAAVAAGHQEPAQHELTGGPMHPDVARRLAELGSYVPQHVDELLDEYRPVKAARRTAIQNRQPDALSVPCDWCQAATGEPCRSRRIEPGDGPTKHRRRDTPHPSRLDDARDAMQQEGQDA